jgi:hypothetical protein
MLILLVCFVNALTMFRASFNKLLDDPDHRSNVQKVSTRMGQALHRKDYTRKHLLEDLVLYVAKLVKPNVPQGVGSVCQSFG